MRRPIEWARLVDVVGPSVLPSVPKGGSSIKGAMSKALALLLPDRVGGRLQGILSLVVSLIGVLGSIVLIRRRTRPATSRRAPRSPRPGRSLP
jgi:hypothetical protein